MENSEEIFHFLEDFSKRKPKTIPQELNEYLAYVARTGDPVYQWSLVKSLFKEKLLNVITDFYETTPSIEIPPYPNVDPFNYDIMKNSLLERLDSFTSAPFTVQRICELLTFPRKQYNRIDKFMRAIEKNILVVSTREPGVQRHVEENGETNEPIVNGSDNNSEYNVDVEMEDMSWKENNGSLNTEPQPSSSDTHISVDDIEARLKAKEESPMDTQEKVAAQYESVTPPELNVLNDDESTENKPNESSSPEINITPDDDIEKSDKEMKEVCEVIPPAAKKDVEMKTDEQTSLIIPEIKIDDADATEMKLIEEAKAQKQPEALNPEAVEPVALNPKVVEPEAVEPDPVEPEVVEPEIVSTDTNLIPETPQVIDESSSDSKDEPENKLSEVLTSSEESSSSDNTDGSSNSPKTDEGHIDIQEQSSQSDSNTEQKEKVIELEQELPEEKLLEPKELSPLPKIETDNYSISDVNSELPQPPTDSELTEDPSPMPTVEKDLTESEESKIIEDKSENNDVSTEKKEE